MGQKNWTQKEIDILERYWGTRSAQGIGKIIGRTEHAVRVKAFKRGLGSALDNFDGFPIERIINELKVRHATTEKWINQYGLPVKKDPTHRSKKNRVVKTEWFWTWAEKHQILIDFAMLEPHALGVEPDWVDVKRRKDQRKHFLIKNTSSEWSNEEDKLLVGMCKAGCYSYREMARRLRRTEKSVITRSEVVYKKTRLPYSHRMLKHLSEEEVQTMLNMFMNHHSVEEIGEKLDISTLIIKCKLKREGYTIQKVIEKDTKRAEELYKEPINLRRDYDGILC